MNKFGEVCKHGNLKRQCPICELEEENEKLKLLVGKSDLPENPRYLLWMLYAGVDEIPDNQTDYILWVDTIVREYRKSESELDIDQWLISWVRNYLREGQEKNEY